MKDKPVLFLKKYLMTGICFLISFSVILLAAFLPRGQNEEGPQSTKRIVRVWNVDTFEGGKGSRTAFLKRAARRAEEKQSGVYYLVSSYTAEGAKAAFSEGVFPDALSFGAGLSCFMERSLPLSVSFAGGAVGEKTLAYPWCRGGYALFSKDGNFEKEGRVAISVGGENLVSAAACLAKISGEAVPSDVAYTGFLSGKFDYLLGTQRDLCRFRSRGVEVSFRPLEEFCDLYQYFSVLSEEKKDACLALFDELLAAKEELETIGMYPLAGDGKFAKAARYTVGVFSSDEARREISAAAQQGDEKKLRNFLKTV